MIAKKSAVSVVVRQTANEGALLPLPKWYISGFVDGEGSFVFFFSPRKDIKLGEELNLDFQIELHHEDREILQRIQLTLGCGHINELNYRRYPTWSPHVKFRVGKIDDLYLKLCPFFTKYPLQAKKRRNFEIFKEAVTIKYQKLHLTPEGMERLKELRYQIEKFKG